MANMNMYLQQEGRMFEEMGTLADAILRFSRVFPTEDSKDNY
jgi:hypothetical protein